MALVFMLAGACRVLMRFLLPPSIPVRDTCMLVLCMKCHTLLSKA